MLHLPFRVRFVSLPLDQKIRDWAQQYARDLEAAEKRPHGALTFARAVADGSCRVLGSAAGLLLGHRPAGAGRGAADNDAGVAGRPGDGGDAMHWKAWRRDGLDALERILGVENRTRLCHAIAFFMGRGGIVVCRQFLLSDLKVGSFIMCF